MHDWMKSPPLPIIPTMSIFTWWDNYLQCVTFSPWDFHSSHLCVNSEDSPCYTSFLRSDIRNVVYITPCIFPVNAHEAVKINRSPPRLRSVRRCSLAALPVKAEMVSESSPFISMFPCFHIVYGWCKLLVRTLIASNCTFQTASSKLDALVGKKAFWSGSWSGFKKVALWPTGLCHTV